MVQDGDKSQIPPEVGKNDDNNNNKGHARCVIHT